jgi:hypothetical protein
MIPIMSKWLQRSLQAYLKGDIDLKDPVNKDMAKAITQDYLKQVGSMSF